MACVYPSTFLLILSSAQAWVVLRTRTTEPRHSLPADAQIYPCARTSVGITENYPDVPGIKQVFVNAHVVEELGDDWAYNEGCLSIPKIREDIYRAEEVTISYQDENFRHHTKTFSGVTARIILHEYDHIDGKLFIDYISPLKRKLLKRKLDDISKGAVSVDYKMLFPKK